MEFISGLREREEKKYNLRCDAMLLGVWAWLNLKYGFATYSHTTFSHTKKRSEGGKERKKSIKSYRSCSRKLKARCHTRFQHVFIACCCVFKEISLDGSNQKKIHEVNVRWKRLSQLGLKRKYRWDSFPDTNKRIHKSGWDIFEWHCKNVCNLSAVWRLQKCRLVGCSVLKHCTLFVASFKTT